MSLLRFKTVRVMIIFFVLYFAAFAVYYVFVVEESKKNYQSAFNEFESAFPMSVVEKSFKSYTSPPWTMSDKQITSKEMFLSMLQRDDLFAIYRENDYWSGEYIYYAAISPTEHSTFIAVFKYKPVVVEVDHGYFSPKTYFLQ